ncbi:MAG: ParB N-terminal domain-containing protein [Nitrospinota bacterium]|nr:ParB N-terminal domain-containing protein [Nitrospinota bacterium]
MLADITPDPRFHCSFPHDIPALEASVARSGIINPVWLIPSEEGFKLVGGFRRYRAAAKAGLEKIPALILEGADEYTLLLLQGEENNHTRGLNLVEKAILMRSAHASFRRTHEEVIDTLFPVMGLERSMVVHDTISRVAEYGPQTQALIASSGMGAKQAALLAQFVAEERELAAGWLTNQRMGLNRCARILEALLDIRVNQGLGAAEVIDEMEKATPQDWDATRRADHIFHTLIKKGKPVLAGMERDFGDALAALLLPAQVRIRPPKNFEGRHLEVTILADRVDSLVAAIAALWKVDRERLEKLFKWI